MMPARAAWKGFLQIRQLQVPVKAFTAASTQPEISLNQLHRDCGQRVRQLKVCPTHGEVTTEDIVPGYEFAEGRYLPLDPADLAALGPEDGKQIRVDCFVESAKIDAVYHAGRTYYVVPDGPPGQRPFNVLREGMRASDRQGVCKVVMANRDLLVLLRPHGRLLAMTVLEYPQRIRPAVDYEGEVLPATPTAGEQLLIGQLIDALTDHAFEVSRYRDAYVEGLNKLIEQQLADADFTTGEIQREQPAAMLEADDMALVAALRASLTMAGVDNAATRVPSLSDRTISAEDELPIQKRA